MAGACAGAGQRPAADRAKALVALGIFELYQNDDRDAAAHLAEGLAGCREHGQAFYEAVALVGLGGLAFALGDHVRSTALLEECLTAARAVPEHRLAGILAGWGWMNLAVVARAQDNNARASEELDTALRLMREADSPGGRSRRWGISVIWRAIRTIARGRWPSTGRRWDWVRAIPARAWSPT